MPLLDGYTLMPRSLDDLTEPVFASFSCLKTLEVGTPVTLENLSQGAGRTSGRLATACSATTRRRSLYDEAGSYNIFLTAVDPNQVCQTKPRSPWTWRTWMRCRMRLGHGLWPNSSTRRRSSSCVARRPNGRCATLPAASWFWLMAAGPHAGRVWLGARTTPSRCAVKVTSRGDPIPGGPTMTARTRSLWLLHGVVVIFGFTGIWGN